MCKSKSNENDREEIASEEYARQCLIAFETLSKIDNLLSNLPAPDCGDGIDGEIRITWSHVGELAEINRRLQSVYDFLNNNEK